MVGRIEKAIITAAGSGNRLLPFSKEVPKEMLPYCAKTKKDCIILKPILMGVYESLYDYGCRKFCFITSRRKRSIEDYFLTDDSAEYSTNDVIRDFYKKIHVSYIEYVQQPRPLGFGDAILRAKMFVNNDIFLVQAGDDMVLSSDSSHIRRLESVFRSNDADAAFLIDTVENPMQYGVVEGKSIGKGLFRVEHIEEKPKQAKTNLAVVATYIFKPSIFYELEKSELDSHGELDITDAITSLAASGKCIAVEIEANEKRIDVGTPEGYVAGIADSFKIAHT